MIRQMHRVFLFSIFSLLQGIALICPTALPAQNSASSQSYSDAFDPAAGSTGMDLPDIVPNFGGQATRAGSDFASNGFNGGIASSFGGGMRTGLRAEMGGTGNPSAVFGPGLSLNQMMRGGLSLPMSSAFGNFRFSYQSPFSPSNHLQVNSLNGYGSGFATYESPHARTGRVDFSASAKVAMGSTNGMSNYGSDWINQSAAGVHGPGGHGANEQPSTALSFHLKFRPSANLWPPLPHGPAIIDLGYTAAKLDTVTRLKNRAVRRSKEAPPWQDALPRPAAPSNLRPSPPHVLARYTVPEGRPILAQEEVLGPLFQVR